MKLKIFLGLILLTIITVSLYGFRTSKKEVAKTPTAITNVTQEWITTGSGGCHVSGYKFTVEGAVGATYFEWEKFNGSTWVGWSPYTTTRTRNYFGDGSCNPVSLQVRACDNGGCTAWYPISTDDCTPFDNPDCR